MNIRLLIAGLALGLLAAGGCAAGPKVITDFDPSAEFSAFHTFAFSGITDRGKEVGPSDSSPLRGRIKQMVDEQLAAKGLRQVGVEDHPDLLVHIFFGVKDKQHVQSTGMTPGLYGPGYGWGPGYYGMGPGYYGRQVETYEYHDGEWDRVNSNRVTTYEERVGTLIVDLAASSKKELVWRSVIKAALGDNLEENFQMANKGVAKAFKAYPPDKKK
jgi:hypothetical protein